MRFLERKDYDAPAVLQAPTVKEYQRSVERFIRDVEERGEQIRAPSLPTVLDSRNLKDELIDLFDGCCAYCERSVGRQGNVHHHRPVLNAEDEKGNSDYLFYVWLAADWDNLYWSCPVCTQKKGSRFIVEQRDSNLIGATVQELRNSEDSLIFDPCNHMPHEHFRVLPNGEIVSLSRLGRTTIRLLDLNEAELAQARRYTIVELVRALMVGGNVAASPTGGMGVSNAVFDIYSDRPDETTPHRGAATLAICDWARSKDVSFESASGFVQLLAELKQRQRERLFEPFLDEAKKPPKEHWKERIDGSVGQGRPYRRNFDRKKSDLAEAPIRSVKIQNFRALGEIELDFPPSNHLTESATCAVILGENATGKSTILEAISLALIGTSEATELNQIVGDEQVTPDNLLRRPDPLNWDTVSDEPLSVDIEFQNTHETVRFMGERAMETFDGTRSTSKIVLAYGPRRYFGRKRQRRFAAPAYRVRSLFDPIATIGNPLTWLMNSDEKKFLAIVRALRKVLLLDNESDFWRDTEAERVMVSISGNSVPLVHLSEGYKSVVAMCVDVSQELLRHYDNLENAHAIVLIDEIETHLHPRWKMQIVARLREAFPKVQFIATTHDPLCLRGMRDGEVFVLVRDDANNRIERLTSLPSIAGMRSEQLLTSEFFGLGSTDPETDAKLYRYEALSSSSDPTTQDVEEMRRLRSELNSRMRIGDTLAEQIFNEAYVESGIDPLRPLSKVRNERRADLVRKLANRLSKQ